MKSVTALAFCGAMISCTHEVDMGNSGDNLGVIESYEKAFISRFGPLSADADWGFGTASNAQTRANTRTIQPSHDFSADAISKPVTVTTSTGMNSANFLEDVPANSGIEYYNNINYGNGFGGNQSCYIDSNTKQVNIYYGTANVNLYVKGDCSSSLTSFYLGGNSNIYLLKNSKLTIDNGFQGNCKVYIAEGAVLTIKNGISTGNVSYYIKGGSMEAKSSMVVNGNNELFIENGSLTVGGMLQIQYSNFYAKNSPLSVQYLDLKGDSFHYEDGDITYTNGNLTVEDTKFYIKNTDLDIPGYLNLISPTTFYNEGGEITSGNSLIVNSSKFYSSGDTEFTYIEANGSGVIYNAANATMTSTSQIKLTNYNNDGTGSTLINDGDLYGTYLGTEGSALFQNNGNTTISGNTILNSNSNTWVNNGQYRTQYFYYSAGSRNVINNCHLTVDEDFCLNFADGNSAFRMDTGAGVVTKNFYGGGQQYNVNAGGPFRVEMGSNSVFKVTGIAQMTATKPNYGFYGPSTGEPAVLLANKITKGWEWQAQGWVVSYGGKLAVAVETTHFEQGHDGDPTHPFIGEEDGFNLATDLYYKQSDGTFKNSGNTLSSINITPTNCNPGFNGGGGSGGGGGGGSTPDPIRVIAEDLNVDSNSDFDFNDVVFDVTWVSESKVKIKLLAAGGTLPLTVGWNGEGENWREYEVHYLLGYSDAAMINTHANVGMHYDGVAPYEFEFNGSFSKDNFAADVRDNIPVKVKRGGVWYPINADQGKAAGKLAVGTDYEPWCNEREDIDDWWQNNNLQGLFSKYTQNPTELTKYWYRNYTHRKGVAK